MALRPGTALEDEEDGVALGAHGDVEERDAGLVRGGLAEKLDFAEAGDGKTVGGLVVHGDALEGDPGAAAFVFGAVDGAVGALADEVGPRGGIASVRRSPRIAAALIT